MNPLKKDRRKTLLADKIEPFEFPFDAQAWQSFELARDVRNQRKAAWRRLIATGLGLFIVFMGVYFALFQHKFSQNKAILNAENNINQKSTPSVFEANLDNKTALNNSNQAINANSNQAINANSNQAINADNNQAINANSNQAINANSNQAINANNNQAISNSNSESTNLDDKQTIDYVDKNADKTTDFNSSMPVDLVLNLAEINKDSINKNDLGPLSIKAFLDTVSSNENAFLPIIPQIRGKKKRELNNSLSIGFGKSLLVSYKETLQPTTFSAIYLRRFTPLMSVGVNATYSQVKDNGRFLSGDIQLNFTLIKRRKFEFNLTTGYGFRHWNYLDGIYYSGNSRGITLGVEMAYFPIKNYFIACRLDNKETNGYNSSALIQIGKLF